jgi:hypothetical protein
LVDANEGAGDILKLLIIIKKAEQFINTNSTVIGERVKAFQTISIKANLKIIKLKRDPNKEVIVMLKAKQFSLLNSLL